MSERMTATDAAPLYRERATAPAHVGGILVLEPPATGFDYDRLVRLVEERISLAPRYRQRVRMVPGHLGTPVWVDDADFDISYHIRRSALPRPGSDDQLLEFCARIQARLLDRHRPLWEMYLVEGLSQNRVAIVTKTHEAMVDERGGIDLTQVILDASVEPRRTVGTIWMPEPEPNAAELLRDAAVHAVRHPLGLTGTARALARDAVHTAGRATQMVSAAGTVTSAVLRRGEASPLQVTLSEQRRLAIARTRLDDYRRVHAAYGCSVNDVVLAVVTGALRGWLLSRSEPLTPATSIRALAPVSMIADAEPSGTSPSGGAPHPSQGGRQQPAETHVRPLLVDLPVGERDPVLRLTQLRWAMSEHTRSGQAVGAETLAALNGFAAPTLHVLGARAAAGLTRRMFNLVVTNVPGPQTPLYAAGARMTELFPVLPLSPGQALSVALTSYDGGVYYGINGDRDAMRDVGVIAELIEQSLAELVAGARSPARAGHEGTDRS